VTDQICREITVEIVIITDCRENTKVKEKEF